MIIIIIIIIIIICNQVTVRLGNNGHAHDLRMRCSI